MSQTSSNKVSITQTPANTTKKARVDFIPSEFEALIQNKGYNVYHERALKCPCHVKNDGSALSSCRNCGGSGWVFLNKIETRMVLSGMNLDTKFKEWSEEKRGTVKITARETDKLSFMDRITVRDAETVTSQLLYPKVIDQKLRAKTIYLPKEIIEIFAFEGSNSPLRLLKEGIDQDYIIEENIFVFSSTFDDWENFTVSIRYAHAPQFNVIDLQRETMVTTIRDLAENGADLEVLMPISAVARRTHYVLDELNYNGEYLFDNSYDVPCSVIVPSTGECSPVVILRSDGTQLVIINPGQSYQLQASQILQAVEGLPNEFIQFLHPGEDYVLPLIEEALVTNNGAETVATLAPGESYSIPIHTIEDSVGNILYTHTFDVDAVIQDGTVRRVNGDLSSEEIAQVRAEGVVSFKRILIFDNFGGNFPQAAFKNILIGGSSVIDVVTEGPTQITIDLVPPEDGILQSSAGTFSVDVPAGTTVVSPDVINVDSDGTPVSTEIGVPFIATLCPVVPEVSIVARPIPISTPVSATLTYPGDHVDLWNNGVFDKWNYGSSAVKIRQLGTDAFTLSVDTPNPYGNLDRYTTIDGIPGDISVTNWSVELFTHDDLYCVVDWLYEINIYMPNCGGYNQITGLAQVQVLNAASFKGHNDWFAVTRDIYLHSFCPDRTVTTYSSPNLSKRQLVSGYPDVGALTCERAVIIAANQSFFVLTSQEVRRLGNTSTYGLYICRTIKAEDYSAYL